MPNKSLEKLIPEEIREDYKQFIKSPMWGVVQRIAIKYIKEKCNVKVVDKKLPADDYKAEVAGRIMAEEILEDIFDEVNLINDTIEFKQKDYS